jgi:glycosyltransferase involved in cell wall biosynthesis
MKVLVRAVLRQRRAILAPNAEWMRPELERLFGDIAEIRPITFGVEDSWFTVVRRPPEKVRQWVAITRLTKNKIGDLLEWGEGLFGKDRQLHLFGPMQEKIELPHWVQYHGSTNPTELLQTWFPQACGLITLSRHDEGRPQVMLEAMAAGLPVIASDLPAHRDIVQHKKNGWLAASPDDLRLGLVWLEDATHNQEVGEAARAWVRVAVGTWDDCADRFAAAYQRLLEPS